MAAGLTVRDLIGNPSLGTRLIAGGGGLDRVLLWAHSCELEDPAKWLGPDELLMTIGTCVPFKAAEQRAFIARLDEAGIAGITIGEHGMAPRLSKAMREEAEERGFPLMLTRPEIPFAALGRTIAAGAADRRTMGVLMLAKLYQVAGRRTPESRRSGRELSDVVGTKLTVVDDTTGCVLIGDEVAAHLTGVHTERSSRRVHSLRTPRPAHLYLGADDNMDGFALMHLTQVLAVDATSVYQEAAERLRIGAAALERALTGHPEGRRILASEWGDEAGGFRVVVADAKVPGKIPLAFALAGLTTAILESSESVLAAVPANELDRVRTLLDELGVASGCSAEHRDLADLTGAVSEARSEHRLASAKGENWREFVGQAVSLLARSHSEAQQICNSVLGPLMSDDERETWLRETLFAFLDNDQSWAETARALGLHRQSLVYRMEQIQKLTGRSVRRTPDVAEFWLARTAWKVLHDGQ
jgi:PucR family transcriptional regulator, purine catabolism regulatory protein